MTLAVPARAKLNLELEVVQPRKDGYHDIRTTIQAVDLHDLIEITPANETSLTTSGIAVVHDADNSVLTAHKAVEQATKRSLPTRFHLHKRIPPGSGLGGASSDAATTLMGLVATYGLDIDVQAVAQKLGADVPFFLAGGKVHAEGRGERLTRLPVDPAWYAIAWPGIELSTAHVYRAWDEVHGESPNHLRRAAEQVEPRLRDFAQRLGDDWHMTGSGSAFFVRCATEQDAHQRTQVVDGWTAVTRAVGTWTY
jgi:4-diphosphocytidyl-2-C-methyl-D-erythritol kinase